MIFTRTRDMLKQFRSDIERKLPSEIYIASYGLWGGVNGKGEFCANCTSHNLLDYLDDPYKKNKCKTHIIIGYDSQVTDVCIATAKRFKNIEFCVLPEMHAKCIITDTGIVAMGSSNFTDSEWFELNRYETLGVKSREYSEVYKYIQRLYNESENIFDADIVDISALIHRG
jgi:hypothetical protein